MNKLKEMSITNMFMCVFTIVLIIFGVILLMNFFFSDHTPSYIINIHAPDSLYTEKLFDRDSDFYKGIKQNIEKQIKENSAIIDYINESAERHMRYINLVLTIFVFFLGGGLLKFQFDKKEITSEIKETSKVYNEKYQKVSSELKTDITICRGEVNRLVSKYEAVEKTIHDFEKRIEKLEFDPEQEYCRTLLDEINSDKAQIVKKALYVVVNQTETKKLFKHYHYLHQLRSIVLGLTNHKRNDVKFLANHAYLILSDEQNIREKTIKVLIDYYKKTKNEKEIEFLSEILDSIGEDYPEYVDLIKKSQGKS